ncbi:MAG: M18 family aminopeptidase, partial [Lachnospiraceae bacterium]
YDLFLANRQKAVQWGADGEFISGPRIDNLECTFAAFHGFLEANGRDISVFCVFDNEEVGSATRQGAAATFLRDNLQRIAEELGMSREGYLRAVARGFMVSEDNAHSIHPGWPEKADPICRPLPNKGIVLKHHAGQRYATDAVSAAVFKRICRLHDIPWQEFANRSDMRGGSTLGNISSTRVPLRTVDIGLAQLAMHSAFETAGTKDTAWMEVFAKAFYEIESLGT